MAVKIRLTRMGKKKQPTYRIVVVDSRKPRDGAYIEQIGRYDPRQEPSLIEIDNDRALDWLQKGAQPTERAQKLLEISGAWTRFRVAKGDIHTIDEAATPAAAAPSDYAPEIHVVGSAEAAVEDAAEEAPAEAEAEAEVVEEASTDAPAEEEAASDENDENEPARPNSPQLLGSRKFVSCPLELRMFKML